MKILFNLAATQPDSRAKHHGGGKYGITVFFELLGRGADMECAVDSSRYLREDVARALKDNNIPVVDLANAPMSEILRRKHYDVYYTPQIYPGVEIPDGTYYIGTHHGNRELEMPADPLFGRYRASAYQRMRGRITRLFNNRWKKVQLKRLRSRLRDPKLHYVTVSEHTKYSILSYLPEINADDIKVFYSPSTIAPASAKSVAPFDAGAPYVLLVSGNRTEKNALRVVMAMDELMSERPEISVYKVVIAGAKEDAYDYKLKNREAFIFMGYVDEDTLESLYRGATLFAYPSLNEGFGYPPLEAMVHGVPVIASPFTSIHEVCGDAALYFNPLDHKEIKGRLMRMLLDEGLRAEYGRRSFERFAVVNARQQRDLRLLADYITDPHAVVSNG